MNFEYTEEQTMLRETVAAFLKDRFPFDRRREVVKTPAGFSPDIWDAFATELGLLAAPFSEDLGGFGAGATGNMIIMEELGKALSVEPWLESIVMAEPLLAGANAACDEALQGVIAGERIIIPAIDWPVSGAGRKGTVEAQADGSGFTLTGGVALVRQAARATHFVIAADLGSAGPALFLVPADLPGIDREDARLVDGGRCADIAFHNVSLSADTCVAEGDDAVQRLAASFDAGLFALCAEAVGIQRMLLEWTVEYSKQRKQFGKAIGEFQALQHRMAEMFIKVEESVSMTILAAASLSGEADHRAKSVAAAKILIDQSARFVGEAAVQIHGGMGMTRELPVADYFTRLIAIAQQMGSTEYHFQRYEAASFSA
ncbi:acyl-CoA dehydrogenase family protein [Sphingobium sp. SCG-1]|uniref:acyl-CoA dehydrogenase family protein n=1 Tax=Sphingobium sp. SCG-1 TaxID=2072936 RepID=UPI00167090FD|nr:acyl-CoA dehydrogenase [Sphingobium sp. SCG-1]